MSRTFHIIKDYYEEKEYIYKKKSITLKEGVTVLVGCNGIGKTTLLKQLRNQLEKENIPVILFDNLHQGGNNDREKAFFQNDFGFFATSLTSSEGENIIMNIGKLAGKLKHFVQYGEDVDDKSKRFAKIFQDYEKKIKEQKIEEEPLSKERWILLDAIDSGLSVDNVVEVKEFLFNTILKNNFGTNIYIVVSANEYELARNSQCFDVYNGKYINIKDYEEYRDFILNNKKEKELREDKIREMYKKRKEK